jgi:hypothetical protein
MGFLSGQESDGFELNNALGITGVAYMLKH